MISPDHLNLPICDVLAMEGVIEGLTWFYRVFGTVVATLAVIGLLPSFVPARRVTKVNPVAALTAEQSRRAQSEGSLTRLSPASPRLFVIRSNTEYDK